MNTSHHSELLPGDIVQVNDQSNIYHGIIMGRFGDKIEAQRLRTSISKKDKKKDEKKTSPWKFMELDTTEDSIIKLPDYRGLTGLLIAIVRTQSVTLEETDIEGTPELTVAGENMEKLVAAIKGNDEALEEIMMDIDSSILRAQALTLISDKYENPATIITKIISSGIFVLEEGEGDKCLLTPTGTKVSKLLRKLRDDDKALEEIIFCTDGANASILRGIAFELIKSEKLKIDIMFKTRDSAAPLPSTRPPPPPDHELFEPITTPCQEENASTDPVTQPCADDENPHEEIVGNETSVVMLSQDDEEIILDDT